MRLLLQGPAHRVCDMSRQHLRRLSRFDLAEPRCRVGDGTQRAIQPASVQRLVSACGETLVHGRSVARTSDRPVTAVRLTITMHF